MPQAHERARPPESPLHPQLVPQPFRRKSLPFSSHPSVPAWVLPAVVVRGRLPRRRPFCLENPKFSARGGRGEDPGPPPSRRRGCGGSGCSPDVSLRLPPQVKICEHDRFSSAYLRRGRITFGETDENIQFILKFVR